MGTLVAALQMCSGIDPERNADHMERLVRQAAASGARYVQTPEMTGLLQRDRTAAAAVIRGEEDDCVLLRARSLAAELRIHLHIGSLAIRLEDGRLANRGFLLAPDGGLAARYDKIHMFDVDLDNGESWRESAAYRPGERALVTDLPFGRFGFAICYDLRFPQLFRTEALAGAEILSVPAAFTRQTGEAHWHILLRARAIENGAFVVAAAQAGRHEDGRETYGHSLIVDPWGRILAEAGGDGEAVVLAEIDVADVRTARGRIPNLKNARDFTLESGDALDSREFVA